ncbi:ABC transporter ATP-binding protein [Paenibacillus sp. GP183]|uniref:ABC transporter ATP-binding protein n=1 Tax=Paenibacillus sp. GP183 TaxID=1882751 RepID=UPI0008945B05|nr:ABC transporter ATP-binding protein [Paenibacillus sp. GP183]SEB54131.1 ABC-2 type transport system ATP-binding protein [Paenibacillus sp. GP183]
MLRSEQLTKRYDNGFMAVERLSIHVKHGDIYGFLGPNGAGKTTTIRMITGLVEPTSGTISVDGVDALNHTAEIRRMIGVLPESHGFYGWMSGEEYLSFFADMYEIPKDQSRRKVTDLLEKVGLAEKRKVPIRQYSRGMKQRLGIAKTIIHEPKLIVLDEPTLGLDPQGQRDITQLIRNLNTEMKVTVFITSHLLKEIDELCNRIAIVKNGKLIDEDLVSEFKTRYQQQGTVSSLEDIFLSLTGNERRL